MQKMEVEHLKATNCVPAWAKRCWNHENVEGKKRVWNFKISWKEYKGPGSSVKLQLQGLDMKLSRFNTIMSPDNRNMNLEETSPDDVKKMLISRVEGRHMASTNKSGFVNQRNEESTQKHRNVASSWLVDWSWTLKRLRKMDWVSHV